MNFKYFFILTVFIGTINTAQAIVDESSDPDMVLDDKLEQDWKTEDTKTLIQKKKNRMKAARLRAEKIRNLPPDAIPLWVASNKSSKALARFTQAASSPETKANQTLITKQSKSEKTKRWFRLLAVLLVVFICGFLKYRNTRKLRA